MRRPGTGDRRQKGRLSCLLLTASCLLASCVFQDVREQQARFVDDVAQNGLWRPFDFVASSYAGIYFLEPDDPRKTPVLFVHGMQGTPASFATLASKLDRSRFVPWFYYYPSGVHRTRSPSSGSGRTWRRGAAT